MADLETAIRECLQRHASGVLAHPGLTGRVHARSRVLARRRTTVAALTTATAVPAVAASAIGAASWLGSSAPAPHVATIAASSSSPTSSPTSTEPTPNPQPCADRDGLFVHLNEKDTTATGNGGVDGALAQLFVEVLNNERYSGPDTAGDHPAYDGARYVVGFPDDSRTEIVAYVLTVDPDGSWTAKKQFAEVNCVRS
jgi:hypothetical protein